MAIIIFLVMLIILLVIFIRMLDNNQRNYQMKETVGIFVDAKVVSWIYIAGRPTRYKVKVEYYINNEKISKTLVTSGRFAAKYERERDIQVVIFPDTGKAYLAEEDWKMQNIGLIMGIISSVFAFCIIILCCLLSWLSTVLK